MDKMIEGKCPMFETCNCKPQCVESFYRMNHVIGIDILKN